MAYQTHAMAIEPSRRVLALVLAFLTCLVAAVPAPSTPVSATSVGGGGGVTPAILDRLKREAAAGSLESQYLLGVIYRHGDRGVEAEPQRALRYFKSAADGGHTNGAVAFGVLLLQLSRLPGGTPAERIVALSLFRREAAAARRGRREGVAATADASTQLVGGEVTGPVEAAYRAALILYEDAAAAAGPPDDGYARGGMPESAARQRTGVIDAGGGGSARRDTPDDEGAAAFTSSSQAERDIAAAYDWAEVAVAGGHGPAHRLLGLMAEYGAGPHPQDFVRARKLYTEGCRKVNLGVFREDCDCLGRESHTH